MILERNYSIGRSRTSGSSDALCRHSSSSSINPHQTPSLSQLFGCIRNLHFSNGWNIFLSKLFCLVCCCLFLYQLWTRALKDQLLIKLTSLTDHNHRAVNFQINNLSSLQLSGKAICMSLLIHAKTFLHAFCMWINLSWTWTVQQSRVISTCALYVAQCNLSSPVLLVSLKLTYPSHIYLFHKNVASRNS